MTQTELEQQVQKNTTAINSLDTAIGNLATIYQLNQVDNKVDQVQTTITALQNAITELQTSIGLINKLSKLLDINIKDDLSKNDLLQYDGDRWTNIKPSEVGIPSSGSSSTVTSIEDLLDVSISNKSHGQVLSWNALTSKWTNTTLNIETGSDFDETAMWQALGGSISNKKINPTYINGQELSLTGITVNGSNIVFTNSNNTVAVSSSNLTVSQNINATGNILSEGEITAYS